MFTVVFDLDGTLADTSTDLLAAANAQFESLGFHAPLDAKDRNTAFFGGRMMLKLGAKRLGLDDPEQFAEAHYLALIEHYGQSLATHTQLYPDAQNVLGALKIEGWLMGVCTNKPIHLADPLLHALQIHSLFGAVIGVNSMPERKPHPKPLIETIRLAGGTAERAILVGDSETDYMTAKAADIEILLVDFDDTGIGERFPDTPIVRNFIEMEKWLFEWRESFG